jgi:hypothetical protein
MAQLNTTSPFSHQLFSDCFCPLFPIVCAIFIIRHNSNSLYFILSTFWLIYNIPWMMKKLKGFCNPRWKLPQTAYNLLRSDQFWERSSDSTLLNLLWSHSETEYFRPSSENPLLIFFQMKLKWYDCLKATIDICFVHGLTENWDSTWTAQNSSHSDLRCFFCSSSVRLAYSLTAMMYT